MQKKKKKEKKKKEKKNGMPCNWFSDDFLKANPGKYHLLINTDENVALTFKIEIITNSFNQKMLDILFENKFDFDECTHPFAFWILPVGVDISSMNAFISLHFGYCQ